MSSKSEAGMTLYRINRDIGVANKIFMGNSHGKTGYNKKMRRVTRKAGMNVHTTKEYYIWKKGCKV